MAHPKFSYDRLFARLLLLTLSFGLAFFIRQSFLSDYLSGLSRFSHYPLLYFSGLGFYIFLWYTEGLDGKTFQRFPLLQRTLLHFRLSLVHLLILVGLSFFLQFHLVSRTFLLLFCLVNLCVQLALESILFRHSPQKRKWLLLGDPEEVSLAKDWIHRQELPVVLLDETRFGPDFDHRLTFLQKYEPGEVFLLGLTAKQSEEIERVIRALDKRPILRDLSILGRMMKNSAEMQRFSEYLKPLFQEPSQRDQAMRTKRGLDLLLCFFLSPLWLPALFFLTLALYITQGSVWFFQRRIGYLGEVFHVIKFKTMHEVPGGGKPDSKADRRLTPLGWILRRTSLDELPQLINVIKGDMSLVGPRPELATIVEDHYTSWHWKRVLLKPGITGLWQIYGRKQPIHSHLKYDFFYLKNQSLWLDLLILIRTIPAVVFRKGAV